MEIEVGKGPETGSGQNSVSPWQAAQEQIWHLDRALTTINGDTAESRIVRHFIVAQIEALKWASKRWEVG